LNRQFLFNPNSAVGVFTNCKSCQRALKCNEFLAFNCAAVEIAQDVGRSPLGSYDMILLKEIFPTAESVFNLLSGPGYLGGFGLSRGAAADHDAIPLGFA
jgi:hypothetical protein